LAGVLEEHFAAEAGVEFHLAGDVADERGRLVVPIDE
jgi:hypothetical protein